MELNNVIKRTNAIFVLHEYKFIISISQTWCVTIFDRVWTLHNQIRVIGLNSWNFGTWIPARTSQIYYFYFTLFILLARKKTRF